MLLGACVSSRESVAAILVDSIGDDRSVVALDKDEGRPV